LIKLRDDPGSKMARVATRWDGNVEDFLKSVTGNLKVLAAGTRPYELQGSAVEAMNEGIVSALEFIPYAGGLILIGQLSSGRKLSFTVYGQRDLSTTEKVVIIGGAAGSFIVGVLVLKGGKWVVSKLSEEFSSLSGATKYIDEIAPISGLGRHADLPMDLRGAGLVQGSSRFNKLESFLSNRYGAKVSFDDTASFGRIDELTGTIHLNPGTATFDVVAHELSHVRFAQAMGKWGNGGRLTNFEVNLMESIGYYGTYRKGIASGLNHADALANSSFGPAFAQQAIQALRSGSPAVQRSLQRAISVFGRDYVEQALRFQGLGIGPGKALPGF
jgi:hypothetical protein